jgi:hypothetical protein
VKREERIVRRDGEKNNNTTTATKRDIEEGERERNTIRQ